jgi:hypothetical protein
MTAAIEMGPWRVAQVSGRLGIHDGHRSGRVGREQAAEVTRRLYLVAAWAALSGQLMVNWIEITDLGHAAISDPVNER